ncbi:MAG: hypothetical protein PF482_15575 [Desulfobacteraceae bacterium]|nr:hypothetical protein [Desulfobacteraceae bacterium]
MDASEKKISVFDTAGNSGKNFGILTLAMFAAGIFMMAWGGYEIRGFYQTGFSWEWYFFAAGGLCFKIFRKKLRHKA